MPTSRRRLLGAGASLLGGALGGCLGGTSDDGLRLESLDVGGSPGGPVPVREPDAASLLDFFATWCAPCRSQMSNLGAVRERFDAGRLHLVSVTSEDDREAVRQFWREHDGTWPVLVDDDLEATQAYDVTRIPTLVLLDADGEEAWRHSGLAGEQRLLEEVREVV